LVQIRNPNKKLNRRGRRAHRGKNGQRLKARNAWQKAVPFQGSSSKDLCALCFLFVHPLVFLRGGSGERKIFSPKEKRTNNRRDPGGRREDEKANQDSCFSPFGRKCSAVSACSAVDISSSSPEGTEAFIIS
jgi:hypothetical protein